MNRLERLKYAEKLVLAAASKLEVRSSFNVISVAEERGCPEVSGNDVRAAYWSLISDGRLIRRPYGVVRA